MIVFVAVACLCAGALAGWFLTLARAGAIMARARADAADEVRLWQEAAARARSEVDRISLEAQSWRAGWHQGRDDVMSIRPLLGAPRGRSEVASLGASGSDDHR